MEKTWQWPLKPKALRPAGVSMAFLFAGSALQAENPKYLPRLGPSPIRFYALPKTPPPFLLPPLDLGVFEEDKNDPESENRTEAEGKQGETPEPKLRTKKTSISSRPEEVFGPLPVSGGEGARASEGASSGSKELSAEALLPDGFDINLDAAAGDRRDLSLFLNYFVGQQQDRRNAAPKQPTEEGDQPAP